MGSLVLHGTAPPLFEDSGPSFESELGPFLKEGIPDLWASRNWKALLPLQRKALCETGLMRGRNLLVTAPGSSGKSMMGELAVAQALASGRRAVVLVPTRALADQQFRVYRKNLSPLGYRVVCASSDFPESDPVVHSSQFDLLVAVIEKFEGWLKHRPTALASIGALVIDEIQILDDPERGPALDLLLTHILQLEPSPQIVALAPPITGAARLARWLRAESLVSHTRPRALRRGILDGTTGEFHFISVDEEAAGTPHRSIESAATETLFGKGEFEDFRQRLFRCCLDRPSPLNDEVADQLACALGLAEREGPLMLFAPTREASRQWALLLAETISSDPEVHAPLQIPECLQSSDRVVRLLGTCTESGVAFHNADMDRTLRAWVEEAFNEGRIRILVCTGTLGVGVNVAANHVICTPWRLGSTWEFSPPSRLWKSNPAPPARVILPLGRDAFAQQGNRAARWGFGSKPGRAIAVAGSGMEARRLWKQLIESPSLTLETPPLRNLPMASVIISALAVRPQQSGNSLALHCRRTWSANVSDPTPRPPSPGRIQESLKALKGQGFVRESEAGDWRLTGLGEILARASLPPEALGRLLRAVPESSDHGADEPWQDLRLLFRIACLPEAASVIQGLALRPGGRPLPVPRSLEHLDTTTIQEKFGFELGTGGGAKGGLSRIEVQAWCAAALLLDWSRGVRTEDIEHRYRTFIVRVSVAAETVARWVRVIVDALRILEPASEWRARFALLGQRLQFGVDTSGLFLARKRIPGLDRDLIVRLVNSGHGKAVAIQAVSLEELGECVGSELAGRIKNAIKPGIPEQRVEASPGTSSNLDASAGQETRGRMENPVLEIDPCSPGLVRFGGKELHLPPLGYDLLLALANRTDQVVTREALYLRLWPESGPEDQQLDAHRRRLEHRLRAVSDSNPRPFIEVVRGMGFRLRLPAHAVRIGPASSGDI